MVGGDLRFGVFDLLFEEFDLFLLEVESIGDFDLFGDINLFDLILLLGDPLETDLLFGEGDFGESDRLVKLLRRFGEGDLIFGVSDLSIGADLFGESFLLLGEVDVLFGDSNLLFGEVNFFFGVADLRFGDLRFGEADLLLFKDDLLFGDTDFCLGDGDRLSFGGEIEFLRFL